MLLNKRLPLIYTFKKIWVELVAVTIISIGITFIDNNYNVNNYSLPMTSATIVGTAISLVLAFRTA